MQVANDYGYAVYNGDLGLGSAIDLAEPDICNW
jgi:ATP-dependent exoDNAse (exonuclease V) alpha subunit